MNNQRLKALLEEVGFVGYRNAAGFVNVPVPAFISQMDRFAELIIQECARVAVATPCPITDEVSLQSQGHTWDMACVESGRAIKDYFGVEE
jgi:hypothetical protein